MALGVLLALLESQVSNLQEAVVEVGDMLFLHLYLAALAAQES